MKVDRFWVGLFLGVALVWMNWVGAASASSAERPNVVLIFIDDMGYADIGPFGAKGYSTPNLDRMAANGRVFRDFVVSSAVCSASRAALLTGCYHQRIGIDGALTHRSDIGLHEDEVTIGEICQSRGYRTACFGKWHLGHHPKFLPHNHGFDRYVGIPYSNDMWPYNPAFLEKLKDDPTAESGWLPLPLIQSSRDGGIEFLNRDMQPADQKEMTRLFTELAVNFIREDPEAPFFVYLPHPMVHVPLFVSDAFEGKSGAGLFGDVVMEVDWSVGQILDVLEELKIDEQTLVIFTSDNGPWLSYGEHAGSAGELREGKGTMFEGGCRVPCVMQWKGTIPAGTASDAMCSTIDVLPTVAGMIGAELPSHPIDGRDIRRLMVEEGEVKTPHEYLYGFFNPASLRFVRDQRWKLMLPQNYQTLAGRAGGAGGIPVAYQTESLQLSLFDLENDRSESTNVAEDHPEVVAELLGVAEKARSELGDRMIERVGSGLRQVGRLQAGEARLEW